MARRRTPDREIHKGIAEAIRIKNEQWMGAWNKRTRGESPKKPEGLNLTKAEWLFEKKPITAAGKSPAALYTLARSRKSRGKSFFGHGNWYKYLEKKHGIVSLDQWKWPDERIHVTIARQLEKLDPSQWGGKYWQKGTNPVTTDGKGLKNLYELALSRRKKRKTFFGHGNWEDYIKYVITHHSRLSPEYNDRVLGRRCKGRKRREKYRDAEIHDAIAAQMQIQHDLSAQHWKTNGEPITPDGRSLAALYSLAYKRRKGGKSFFGHGSWKEYVRYLREGHDKGGGRRK